MTDRNVYIAGFGACTSLGNCSLSSAAAVRSKRTLFTEHPFMIDTAGERMIVARASQIPQTATGVERFWALLAPALDEVLAHKELFKTSTIPLILGLPEPRPGISSNLPIALKQKLLERPHAARFEEITTLSLGHAAGLCAIQAAIERVKEGRTELCIAGGVDTYLEPLTLEWLEEHDQLHGAGIQKNTWGFIPGEAACLSILGTKEALDRFRQGTRLRIKAIATHQEENCIKTTSVCTGEGLIAAVKQVFGVTPSGDYATDVICDLNGEMYRADEMGFTASRCAKWLPKPPVFHSPAEYWGDVGAASGPLFAMLAFQAAQKGYARGPLTLLTTSSESGLRAAALLESHPFEGQTHANH